MCCPQRQRHRAPTRHARAAAADPAAVRALHRLLHRGEAQALLLLSRLVCPPLPTPHLCSRLHHLRLSAHPSPYPPCAQPSVSDFIFNKPTLVTGHSGPSQNSSGSRQMLVVVKLFFRHFERAAEGRRDQIRISHFERDLGEFGDLFAHDSNGPAVRTNLWDELQQGASGQRLDCCVLAWS
jgi:hypothetical protein